MENSPSKILIETVLKKALRDMKDSSERNIRNLVDMGLNFSDDYFQRKFFMKAQEILKDKNSPYYNLIKDIATNIDSEYILNFGMNIGYNTCILGAKQIRNIENTEGFNVPWTIFLSIDSQKFKENQNYYNKIITQGENLGIYTWLLYFNGNQNDVLSLINEHKDSAFILFCNKNNNTINSDLFNNISKIHNLMLALEYSNNVVELCSSLREKRMPYSIYFKYDMDNFNFITTGQLCNSLNNINPIFTIMIANPKCPIDIQHKVYNYIKDKRNSCKSVLWELQYDNTLFDSVISTDPYTVAFDPNGNICTMHQCKDINNLNIFQNDLRTIFKLALSKTKTSKE